jgi:hypothetical protein
MLKFHTGFWALAPGTTDAFVYPPVVKMFDCVSGFASAGQWAQTACQPNVQVEYGTNFTLWNAGGGGISRPNYLYFIENTAITADYNSESACWSYTSSGRSGYAYYPECSFQDQYLSEKWMGVEFHLNSGTVDTANGFVEFWVYDEEGNQIGYHRSDNLLLKKTFDYAYNKIVLGGNYQCAGDTVCPGETRWYFDDFIVDSHRIGPTYFNLIDSNL